MLKLLSTFIFNALITSIISAKILIPMDDKQRNHLRAYGVVYYILTQGGKAEILLNYRGGAFLIPENQNYTKKAALMGVSFTTYSASEQKEVQRQSQTENVDKLELEKAPRIAIYKPPTSEPWDDAVTMVLNYAKIPYTQLWDEKVLKGKLRDYDWLHLHHEDFTGQYGKFYAFARNMQWYQKRRLAFEKMARSLGYTRVADQKRDVALKIQSYVANGGFLFAMCSATDSLDISLAAQKIDIVDPLLDGTPISTKYNEKLEYSYTFGFEKFKVVTDPYVYEFSDIDINLQKEGIISDKDYFTLFEFNAHIDPIPTLLTQNHVREVKGFLGQTTAFSLDKIKTRVIILGQTLGTNRVKYMYGSYQKGFFSFYGGHDPEDYQHLVGDPPTNLALHKNSAGYRLILNNIFLPAAKKKKRKT